MVFTAKVIRWIMKYMSKAIIAFFSIIALAGCYDNAGGLGDKQGECYSVTAPPRHAPILLNKCTGETWTFRSVTGLQERYWWHPIKQERIDRGN